MPTKKYRVDTDKGSYEVEVEEPLAMGVLEQGRRSAAGEGPVTGNESKAPDTWGGGFLKSLKDQFITPDLIHTMKRATDPHDLSSYTTALLAPLDATRSVSAGIVNGLRTAAKAAGSKTSGAGGVASFPFRMVNEFNESLPSTISKRVGEFKGSTSPASVPPKPPVTSGGSDIVDRMLQTRRAAPTGPAPRLVKSAAPPPSLDDVLSGALEDVSASPSLAEGRSTLPPEMRTAGEGTIKQSGKFSKSGSKGQAGGYSSGRPSITPDREQELHDAFMERMGMGQPNPSTETLGPGPHPEMAAERAVVGQEPGVGAAQAPDSNPAVGSSSAGPSADQPSAAMSEPKLIDESSPWLGDENWSSGAESGSPEALRARALHSYAGEMNQVPRVFQAPGIGDLLARILAEGRGK